MNKSEAKDSYIPPEYFPLRRSGSCLFNKMPDEIPEDVLELIGKRGVRDIHRKLAKLIAENKEHFGNGMLHFYGLFYFQQFLDIKSRTTINVFQIIDNENKKDKVPYTIKKGRKLPFPIGGNKLSDKAAIRKVKLGGFCSASDDDMLQYLPRGENSLY